MPEPSFLVLAANTPWVFALADALSATQATTAMRFYDVATWRRLRPTWPTGANPALRRVMRVMPPGYAGQFQRAFNPIMRALIDAERRALQRRTGFDPYVIAPFPYLEPWLRGVRDDRLIYYSLDEYAFYDPARTALTHAREDMLIGRAARTICLSEYQANVLRKRNPQRADDIRHFPLGVDSAFLNPTPHAAPTADVIGYVGTMGDRVDWAFVDAVATAAPHLRFEFVGGIDKSAGGGAVPAWQEARARALALPNVAHLGSVPQAEVKTFYWRSAVNWMPYDVTHGFNLAACPTKIMDAIASGRPFASTDVPECRLYPELVHIAHAPEQMASLLVDLAMRPRPDSDTMLAFARDQQWSCRARTLLDLL